jgi:predicted RNA methylase
MRVGTETLAVLSAATTCGNALRLGADLERKTYQAVAKVIEAAGGKWNRKAGAHLFDGDAAEAIDPVILTGEVVSKKTEFGQFETPSDLAVKIIAMANLQPGMRLLEPSCGRSGQLVFPMLESGPRRLDCYEIDEASADRIDMRICNHFADLRAGRPTASIVCADFLTVIPIPVYDAVVMNPPFAGLADVRHVTHAVDFLKPGTGRLVAIMSASVQFRRERIAVDFRAMLQARGGTITALPDDSFRSAGTSVRTVVVTL